MENKGKLWKNHDAIIGATVVGKKALLQIASQSVEKSIFKGAHGYLKPYSAYNFVMAFFSRQSVNESIWYLRIMVVVPFLFNIRFC